MKRALSLALIAVLLLGLCSCGSNTSANCSHNYYLADYVNATAAENGYKKYSCSNCGHSYSEIIPAQQGNSQISSDAEKASEPEEDLTRKRSVNLFDYPVYSQETGKVKNLYYQAETFDVDGWKHSDCYEFFGSPYREWVRYEINGKYSTIKGTIYDMNDSGGAGWLEFYDGDDFLAATKKVGDGTTSTEFEIDITGVQFLTVYFCATQDGTWMIADDIVMYQ